MAPADHAFQSWTAVLPERGSGWDTPTSTPGYDISVLNYVVSRFKGPRPGADSATHWLCDPQHAFPPARDLPRSPVKVRERNRRAGASLQRTFWLTKLPGPGRLSGSQSGLK